MYETLFDVVQSLAPETICEIGVRAGYSAKVMLDAAPRARIIGIDADIDHLVENSHGGIKGLWMHAVSILPEDRFQLMLVNSHSIKKLPRCDLAYIDGDHSFEGCLADIRLAARSTRTILCDDVDYPTGVRQACEQFVEERRWTATYIANGLTGLMLLKAE
jgi:predicted O-methyltransferase YrrM